MGRSPSETCPETGSNRTWHLRTGKDIAGESVTTSKILNLSGGEHPFFHSTTSTYFVLQQSVSSEDVTVSKKWPLLPSWKQVKEAVTTRRHGG